MHTVDEISESLRALGLRVTPQRHTIARLLRDNDRHPTIEALYEEARAEMPAMSLKTVYQTVHDLEALGAVKVLNLGTGSIRVEPNVEHEHHHLVCTGCGAIRDLPVDYGDLSVPSPYEEGFEVDAVEVVFRGRCEACREHGRREDGPRGEGKSAHPAAGQSVAKR